MSLLPSLCASCCAVSSSPPWLSRMSFSRDSGHGEIRSFPTRRSSDLEALARAIREWIRKAQRRSGRNPPEDELPAQRSEEHTSELQSHSDLVCRLLLEKKKNPHD